MRKLFFTSVQLFVRKKNLIVLIWTGKVIAKETQSTHWKALAMRPTEADEITWQTESSLKTLPITSDCGQSVTLLWKRAHGQTHQGLTKSPWSGTCEAVWVGGASSCANAFPLWWRHTAVSTADAKANSRPFLNCCWHPHRLLLQLPHPPRFILLLHLLTSSSLLLHVAQCSDTGWGFRPCGNFSY